jgi:hypothetical protein
VFDEDEDAAVMQGEDGDDGTADERNPSSRADADDDDQSAASPTRASLQDDVILGEQVLECITLLTQLTDTLERIPPLAEVPDPWHEFLIQALAPLRDRLVSL